jgi:hypothetical protein
MGTARQKCGNCNWSFLKIFAQNFLKKFYKAREKVEECYTTSPFINVQYNFTFYEAIFTALG